MTVATRPPLMPLDEALELLRSQARVHRLTAPVDVEQVSTFDALGRVLAHDLRSGLDVPPADNTSMDGYALRVADYPSLDSACPVSQRIPAGVVGQPLEPRSVARIFTGAQIPAGADAVVMQELTHTLPDGRVQLKALPQVGQWIRRRGEDLSVGQVVLPAGTRLNAAALGLAASVGVADLPVWRRPRVAVMSTGDELTMPGEPLRPGAIYNSNRYTLRGLLQTLGCEVMDLGIVPDQLTSTVQALRRAAEQADLILTSGGVSVGEEDHLKPAMAQVGELALWQMAIKPGKPLAFGRVRRDEGGASLYLGLPGNPVSSFVTFLLAVVPVLRELLGQMSPTASALPPAWPLPAHFAWSKPDKRREFLRARRNAQGGVEIFPNQSSGVLTSAFWAEGLVDVPPGQAIGVGDTVNFIPFSAWLS